MTPLGLVRRMQPLTICASLMLATTALGLQTLPVQAQDSYPDRAIKLIVPFAPGGLPDTVARIVGAGLQDRLKQPVVVENRPGSGGGVAAVALMNAPADGYQFIVSDNSFLSINPFMYKELPYDPKEITTVAQVATAPLFLATNPNLPVKTLQEFIDYARANPGKINYGSSGIGTAHHLSMEAIKAELKLDMVHVPFRGTGESVPALLGGHVDALFSAYPSLSGAVGKKLVIILATNGAKRWPELPDVPAVAEFIPGFDFASRISIYARANTPDPIVQRVAAEAVAVTREPDTMARFSAVGVEADGLGPIESHKVLAAEIARVTTTVKAAGITPQ
jgi:tripartite-type tricarboxylate transporter receptor subunit TctC